MHHPGGLPWFYYLNPGAEQPLLTYLTCSVVFHLLLCSESPPGSLLPQATLSSHECSSYLLACPGSWQLYSESKNLCNLEQACCEKGLGSLLLSRREWILEGQACQKLPVGCLDHKSSSAWPLVNVSTFFLSRMVSRWTCPG